MQGHESALCKAKELSCFAPKSSAVRHDRMVTNIRVTVRHGFPNEKENDNDRTKKGSAFRKR